MNTKASKQKWKGAPCLVENLCFLFCMSVCFSSVLLLSNPEHSVTAEIFISSRMRWNLSSWTLCSGGHRRRSGNTQSRVYGTEETSQPWRQLLSPGNKCITIVTVLSETKNPVLRTKEKKRTRWWQGHVELNLRSGTSRKEIFEHTPVLLILNGGVQRCAVGPEGSCEECGRLGNKHDMCSQCHESAMCYVTSESWEIQTTPSCRERSDHSSRFWEIGWTHLDLTGVKSRQLSYS